ncbi:hypothetical protein SDC9_155581 [bioreactor metagenome]|uniref:DUF2726 domain-containing protein n=1 Tax=bioreactor metagenome TaxID=1076179 RepID=A0A645F4E1_9ZZZZ
MLILIIIAIIAILVFAIIIKKKSETEKSESKSDISQGIPVKRTKLLSAAEINFYQSLKQIIPSNQDITCKCRLEDIMYVEKGPERQSFRNRIKSRHVDFIIFNSSNGFTDYAIELDDSSHITKQEEDTFKDNLFKKINMPLIRIKVQAKYDPDELKKIIEENTGKK